MLVASVQRVVVVSGQLLRIDKVRVTYAIKPHLRRVTRHEVVRVAMLLVCIAVFVQQALWDLDDYDFVVTRQLRSVGFAIMRDLVDMVWVATRPTAAAWPETDRVK